MINQVGPLNLYSEWNVSNVDNCIKYSLLWAVEVDIWDITNASHLGQCDSIHYSSRVLSTGKFWHCSQYFLCGTLVPLKKTGQRKQRKNNVLKEGIGQVNYCNLRGAWQPGYSTDKVICSDFQFGPFTLTQQHWVCVWGVWQGVHDLWKIGYAVPALCI